MHRLIKPVTSIRRCWPHPPPTCKPGRHACQIRTSRMVLPVAVLTAMAFIGTGRSLADVRPETMNGPPLLPIPTYEEVGLPMFVMPSGTPSTVPTTPPGNGAGQGGNGPGGGWNDAGPGGNGTSVATSWTQYLGQAVGSGECVALIQIADSTVGLTRTWAPGNQVQGNTELRPGTAIATFGDSGRYENRRDGSSHAAIYLGQNAQGIQVMDQWAGQEAAYRTIPWTNRSGKAADTGSAFRVVTHAS